jgi:hypothetical protein
MPHACCHYPLQADPDNQDRIYRKFQYGKLLSLLMLDTRFIGRDQQYAGRYDKTQLRYYNVGVLCVLCAPAVKHASVPVYLSPALVQLRSCKHVDSGGPICCVRCMHRTSLPGELENMCAWCLAVPASPAVLPLHAGHPAAQVAAQ